MSRNHAPRGALFREGPRDFRVARRKFAAYELHFLAEIERENVAGQRSVRRAHALLHIFGG